jgi:uncharacterized membrane protein
LGKAALPTLSITASRQENDVGVDLTGKAASPRDAHRVRLLWALPPLILASAIAVSVLAYPHLPEVMPTHWGVHGEPTNLMPRGFAASVMPAMMVWIGFLTGLLMWSGSQTREGRDLPAWLSPMVTSANGDSAARRLAPGRHGRRRGGGGRAGVTAAREPREPRGPQEAPS